MIVVMMVLVFAACALLMVQRRLPALLAVPLMAVLLSIVAGVPFSHLGGVISSGSFALAHVYTAVIFGALLGRVTIDTGIARALVNLAAEYGGERPLLFALGLCAVTALLFISLSGLGAIVMVGSIVLPTMLAVGVPRRLVGPLFLMSFALGFIFNIANWTFYTSFFGVQETHLLPFALALAAIDATALVAFAIVGFRRERDYATWAQRRDDEPEEEQPERVPAIALLTPLLPIPLYFIFHLDAIVAFALAAILGAAIVRPRALVQTLVGAAIRGIEDVAPAIVLFMGIGMLLVATKEPAMHAALAPLAGAWIADPRAFVLVFGILSPLALYRGPLNPFGVGIAFFAALVGAHVLPPLLLVAGVMALVSVQNVCDPTNTANVWVANQTGDRTERIMLATLPYQFCVAVLAALLAISVHIARASTIEPAPFPSGLLAPTHARDSIVVDDDRRRFSRLAAQVIATRLSAAGLHVIRRHTNPNRRDCSQKTYASYLFVSQQSFTLVEGVNIDIGLRLEDCGGWIVHEWHDHRVLSLPNRTEIRRLADEGVARMLAWRSRHPRRSSVLFARGIALPSSATPTYYYSLFKTVDGFMRAYVRAGGPAWEAGMRSGEIVDKIDGRWWWEYGTFQSQARAYDGIAHRFQVRNGKKIEQIRLAAPVLPAELEARLISEEQP
ncbi:MAG TPA: hypothetical protein VMV73_04250 [Candidatus Dormibacteraeota bacterium]|nr:hypothetical protein [Candidatus Dormibacteraeota bacterium]